MVSVASRVIPVVDRRFFSWMAIAMAVVTFMGFAPTYYLSGFNDSPALTPSVHLHGLLSTAWIVLLIVQTRLVAAGRRDVHKKLGILGALIASAIVVGGVIVAINSERRVHSAATADTLADPYVFLIFPISAATLFLAFAVAGIVQRDRADSHKRLMLLATAHLTMPALARIVNQVTAAGFATVPGVIGASVLVAFYLIPMAIHDYRSRGRLHPVTFWGAICILITEPLRFAIGFSAPWQEFARSVMN
jgi:hypothetical protein